MRPTARHLAIAVVAAAALLALLALPAAGKEFLQARLDAPIAMDTPPGTEILVGVTVDDGSGHLVEGSPIALILTGRDGSTTRAAGAADGKSGHYVMRIEIPAGGARRAEVVMHGTSDLPIMLQADPFTFGGVTARTAQVAPPLAPPMTPFPRASVAGAAAGVPAAPVAQPALEAVAVPGTGSEPAPVVVALFVALAAVLVVGLAALVARVRGRAGRRVSAAGRAPGA